MARNFKEKRVNDNQIDSEEEIWRTIDYLDPDGALGRTDIVVIVIGILLVVLIGVITFWLHQ
jgi:hypothetical protein